MLVPTAGTCSWVLLCQEKHHLPAEFASLKHHYTLHRMLGYQDYILPDQTSLRQLEDSPSGHPTGRWGCGGPQALPPSPTVPSPAPRAHVSSGLQSCGAGQTALPPAGRGASVQSDSFLSSSRLAPSFILPHSHPFPAFHGLVQLGAVT